MRSSGNNNCRNEKRQVSPTEYERWKTRFSGAEDTIEEMDKSVNDKVKSKNSYTKHPGNWGPHEQTKTTNNRDRRIPAQRPKIFQQNHRRKFFQSKEGHAKEIGPERMSPPHIIIKTLYV